MRAFDLNDYLENLKTLVNIDSGSSNISGIHEVADYFESRYRELGCDVTRVGGEDGSAYGLEVKNHPGESVDVLLVGHMDTVFKEGTASLRPFRVDDTRAFGPGVADMKSGLLLIYYLVESLVYNKTNLRFCVAMNGDEETGSIHSSEWLKRVGAKAKYCFVFEPGRPGGAFVKRRKGVADFNIRFSGIASHAGVAPELGSSAILELGHWICELDQLNDIQKGTSVNPGVVKGGTAPNIIADYAECLVDVRFNDPEELIRVEHKLQELTDNPYVSGVKIEFIKSNCVPPMNLNENTMKMIRIIDQIGEERGKPIKWVETGGTSDANYISAYGTPTLDGCGPCGAGLHSESEYIDLSSIEDRLDLMKRILLKLENLGETAAV